MCHAEVVVPIRKVLALAHGKLLGAGSPGDPLGGLLRQLAEPEDDALRTCPGLGARESTEGVDTDTHEPGHQVIRVGPGRSLEIGREGPVDFRARVLAVGSRRARRWGEGRAAARETWSTAHATPVKPENKEADMGTSATARAAWPISSVARRESSGLERERPSAAKSTASPALPPAREASSTAWAASGPPGGAQAGGGMLRASAISSMTVRARFATEPSSRGSQVLGRWEVGTEVMKPLERHERPGGRSRSIIRGAGQQVQVATHV